MSTFIVGEIGCNHQGNVETALQLIDTAIWAGFDAVKFQKRNPELYPETPKNSAILGPCTYREHRRALEFGQSEYDRIDEYCRENGIEWFASPWDLDSIDFLSRYDLKQWKIASMALGDLELVENIAEMPGAVIMSTGLSDDEMVTDALRVLRYHKDDSQITLLHCCGEYPTPRNHVNLRRIPAMRALYPNNRIGYSSHDGGVLISVGAFLMGAEVIEVHITLDRTMPGSDHGASLGPEGMRMLVERIRAFEEALGVPEKQYYEAERKKRESMEVCR